MIYLCNSSRPPHPLLLFNMPSDLYLGSYTATIGGIAVVLGLDVLAVGTRFYVRKSLNHKLKLYDWLVLPALLLNIGMATAMFYGAGREMMFSRTVKELPGAELTGKILEAYSTNKQIEFAVLLMSLTALTLIKVSCLFFYKSVFVYGKWRFSDPRNVLMNLLIAVTILWDIGFSITLICSCRPKVSTYWSATTSTELTTKCINPFVYMYALSITDFITDAITFLIPIPMIWQLQLPMRRKFGVLIIFTLGSLAVLASVIRLIWMVKIMAISTNPSAHLDALTLLPNELFSYVMEWELAPSSFWYIIESEIALLAICLPAIAGIRRTPVANIVRSVQSRLILTSNASKDGTDEKPGEKPRGSGSTYSEFEIGSALETKEVVGHLGVLPDLESQSLRSSYDK